MQDGYISMGESEWLGTIQRNLRPNEVSIQHEYLRRFGSTTGYQISYLRPDTHKDALPGTMEHVIEYRERKVANQGDTPYYKDPLFYVNGVLGFAGIGLAVKGEMWKTNELWHIQKNGIVRTAWSSLKNNNFVKASKDLSLSKTAGLRSFSNKVAVASLLATGYGIATTGVIKPSDVLNATMAGISFTGVGSLVSGAYFITDLGFTVFTGKGLGQRLDESIGTYKAW